MRTYYLAKAPGVQGETKNFNYLDAYASNLEGYLRAETPSAAELVLYVDEVGRTDHFYRELREDPLVRTRRDDCFIFTTHDRVVPYLPGVYASARPSEFQPSRQRSGFFLPSEFNPQLTGASKRARDILFSYVGRGNKKPFRLKILEIQHPEAFIRDTFDEYGDEPSKFSLPKEDNAALFAEVMTRSLFVLCPRGYGTSSIRLFEAMSMGCVPIIISDEWIPPAQIRWSDFSIRVPESCVPDIPEILQAYRAKAANMGQAAAEVWRTSFQGNNALEGVLRQCELLKQNRKASERIAHLRAYSFYVRPYYAKRIIASTLHGCGLR
jgi:hypothetical protein